MTVFSFHPVKSIAMGEGGCITTNNKEIFERLSKIRNHGIEKQNKNFFYKNKKNQPWYYEMQELGYHYRATDIQCALGISQLKKLINFSKREDKLQNITIMNSQILNMQNPYKSTEEI